MEALERRGKMLALFAIMFIVFWSHCKGVSGHKNATKMSYVCPPQFIRLGHSCYFFSDTKVTWQNAHFACKDRGSNLSVPARWEDRNLRNYLNGPDIDKASRWIGGIYDSGAQSWKWGGELRRMRYQSFSKMKKLTPAQLQWHCIAMMPELLYRWSPRSCFEPRQYICQTKLLKIPKSKLKELRNKWKGMGKINEITAPSVSREIDPRINDVTINPVINPKNYNNLGPSALRRRPNTIRYYGRPGLKKRSGPLDNRKLTRPFPGFKWNRRNPEASYRYNVELLKSGRTGLTPQQVHSELTRIKHLKDRQLAKQQRQRGDKGDWLVNDTRQPSPLAQAHARTYLMDNNISALHPKTIVEEFDIMPPTPIVTNHNIAQRAVGNQW